jgi:lipopolysaccharide transport system permease protein
MLGIVKSVARNWSLIGGMVRRDIIGRYSGSALGLLWSLFNPILMLGVYTFAFGYIFKAKWQGMNDDPFSFALVLFPALLVFNYFAECVTRAPTLITGNPAYVKKVVFPLEVLPVVVSLSALFHLFVGVTVWSVIFFSTGGKPHWSMLFVLPAIVPLVLFCLGTAWILASFGVYLRDVQQIIGVITSAMMFLSPVFYSVESVPSAIKDLIWINPLTSFIEMTRSALVFDQLPTLLFFGSILLGSILVAMVGAWWFSFTKRGFADVV